MESLLGGGLLGVFYLVFSILILILKVNGSFWKIFMLGIIEIGFIFLEK